MQASILPCWKWPKSTARATGGACCNVLNAGFDQVYNLLNSAVMETGDILDTLVYRYGMKQANYSMSTACSLFKSAVSAVLMIISYRAAYKFSGYRLF